jgi:hypothetical protein
VELQLQVMPGRSRHREHAARPYDPHPTRA